MLYVLYVLKPAKRADFSTISIFVNLLMSAPQSDKILASIFIRLPGFVQPMRPLCRATWEVAFPRFEHLKDSKQPRYLRRKSETCNQNSVKAARLLTHLYFKTLVTLRGRRVADVAGQLEDVGNI